MIDNPQKLKEDTFDLFRPDAIRLLLLDLLKVCLSAHLYLICLSISVAVYSVFSASGAVLGYILIFEPLKVVIINNDLADINAVYFICKLLGVTLLFFSSRVFYEFLMGDYERLGIEDIRLYIERAGTYFLRDKE